MLVRLLAAVAFAVALAAATAPRPARAVDPAGAATALEPSGASTTLEPTGATTTSGPAAPDATPISTVTGRPVGEDSWIDVGHAFIEHRIFAPVLRVDRFFSDERDLEPERARSFLQWRQELRFQQYRSTPSYTTTVGANLKLPGLNKELRKLQVEVTGQTRDAFTALFPGDHASPGEVPTSDSSFGRADAGLGYRLFDAVASTAAAHGDLGAGVIFALPPGVYGRARLRFVESLGKKFLAREALSGFWRTDTGLGSTASGEVERPFAHATLVRLSGSTTLTEKSRGLEWGGDLSALGTLRARVGAQVGFGVSGATRSPAPDDIDVYRFYVRLRRDFYRKWIFLELGPEYGWPWTPENGRRGVWAVVLRLEVQFQGNEDPRVRIQEEEEERHEQRAAPARERGAAETDPEPKDPEPPR